MHKLSISLFFALALAGAASAQSAQSGTSASVNASSSTSASANAGQSSAAVSSGTAVNAELLTSIDAKKAHPGQRVVARTTQNVKQNGHIVLRKGTRLLGHVTEAQARTKANAESSVGIAFDNAVMKNGQEVPFHATIQALAESQAAAEMALENNGAGGMAAPAPEPMPSGGMAGGGGLLGGAGGAVGSTAGVAGSAAGNLGRTAGGTLGSTTSAASSASGNLRGLDAAGQLTSNSSGVIGLQGLQLTSAASNATEAGSVISSSSRNVHLSSGTQMLLKANSAASNGGSHAASQKKATGSKGSAHPEAHKSVQ